MSGPSSATTVESYFSLLPCHSQALTFARLQLPGVIILVHGVNSDGEWFDATERGLCEGLNARMARLDAVFFRLYGLDRQDADYVLERFPIVREHDEREFGRYRTKDLILGYLNAVAAAVQTKLAALAAGSTCVWNISVRMTKPTTNRLEIANTRL